MPSKLERNQPPLLSFNSEWSRMWTPQRSTEWVNQFGWMWPHFGPSLHCPLLSILEKQHIWSQNCTHSKKLWWEKVGGWASVALFKEAEQLCSVLSLYHFFHWHNFLELNSLQWTFKKSGDRMFLTVLTEQPDKTHNQRESRDDAF